MNYFIFMQNRNSLNNIDKNVFGELLGDLTIFLSESLQISLSTVLENQIPFSFFFEIGYEMYDISMPNSFEQLYLVLHDDGVLI